MLFDANSNGMATIYNNYLEHDTLKLVLDYDPMFASMFRNREFQEKFANRILYIGRELLTAEKCGTFTDGFFETYQGLYRKTGARLENDTADAQLEMYRKEMHTFFAGRYQVILTHLNRYLDSAVWAALKK